ncbi:MAG: hypothetical protein QNL62_01350 [Gammaproteobacteria bacterium]|nr:hypothetical protein [Gammaproteobacteria bacterium]
MVTTIFYKDHRYDIFVKKHINAGGITIAFVTDPYFYEIELLE